MSMAAISLSIRQNQAGIREIPMTEGVVEAFKMEKEYQEENNIISVSHIEVILILSSSTDSERYSIREH